VVGGEINKPVEAAEGIGTFHQLAGNRAASPSAMRHCGYRNIMSELCGATEYCTAKSHETRIECAPTSWNSPNINH
jgi:hypothetical protein